MNSAIKLARNPIQKIFSRSNKNQQPEKIMASVVATEAKMPNPRGCTAITKSQDNRSTSVTSCQCFSEEKNNWTANLVPDKKAPDETVGAHDGREPRELMTQKQTLKINRATDEYLISDSAYVPVVQHC